LSLGLIRRMNSSSIPYSSSRAVICSLALARMRTSVFGGWNGVFKFQLRASSMSFISFGLSRSDCINLIASLTGASIGPCPIKLKLVSSRKMIWPRRSASAAVPAFETRPCDQFSADGLSLALAICTHCRLYGSAGWEILRTDRNFSEWSRRAAETGLCKTASVSMGVMGGLKPALRAGRFSQPLE
jgi:hypothetical protein